jgi:hypothetical protein
MTDDVIQPTNAPSGCIGASTVAAAVRDRIAAQFRSEIINWNEKNALYRQFVDAIRPGDPPDPPENKTLGDWLALLEKLREP